MSFLHNYTILTGDNEAPEIFHRWSSISLLSHVIGRRVWLDWGIVGTVHLNLYIVLVGGPGSKKSTAMKIARGFAGHFEDLVVAGESMTKEAITQKMSKVGSPCIGAFEHDGKTLKYSQLSIFANELINLINSGGNPIGMIDFFTDIWDQDVYKVETKNMGNDIINGPYISILGCLTPETIKLLMSQRVVSGGMVRRCLFVKGEACTRPNAFPETSPEQVQARMDILRHLNHIRSLHGEMKWSEDAKAEFKLIYDKEFYRKKTITDQVLAFFLETKPALILKVAALLELAKENPQLILTKDSIIAANYLISEVEGGASYLFSNQGRNQMAPIMDQILALVSLNPAPISKKEIYLAFRKDATGPEIDEMIEQFVKTEQLEVQVFTNSKTKSQVTLVSTKAGMANYVSEMRKKQSAGTD